MALVDAFDRQLAPLEQELRRYARRQLGCQALMAHYGIGELTAPVILSELGGVSRLSASRKAVRCAGLDVGVHRSDRRLRAGTLIRQGSPQVALGALDETSKGRRGRRIGDCVPTGPDALTPRRRTATMSYIPHEERGTQMIKAYVPGPRRESGGHRMTPPAAAVPRVISSPGHQLDPAVGQRVGAAYGADFAHIRVHTDSEAARSARDLGASAYTIGRHVVFAQGGYAPGTRAGDHLLAHELWHVVQQQDSPEAGRSARSVGDADDRAEHEAEQAASTSATAPSARAKRSAEPPPYRHGRESILRRRVEMRDVGRGEQSGFARLPDLVLRLNTMSQGLTFSLDGANLKYALRAGGTLSEFDRLMIRVIDLPAVLPLRLTSRHGLLGSHATGFTDQVIFDAFTSGYLDVDDLLASSDLGVQVALAHVLTERSATRDYARRIGTPGLAPAFAGPHASGKAAEEQVLRDFFGDPTIRVLPEPVHAAIGPGSRITVRGYRNSRRDTIQWRMVRGSGATAGVDPSSIRVLTRDGRTLTAEEYRGLLRAEAVGAQVRSERLRGATEHTEGSRRVPAP